MRTHKIKESIERSAVEVCMRLALKNFKEGDIELAIDRSEDATRSLKALQQIKKAN